MIRKTINENEGCWHVEVLVDGEWQDVSQLTSEEEADEVIEILLAWSQKGE